MTEYRIHWHPTLTLPCLVWRARICKNSPCVCPSTILVFDSCKRCANMAGFCEEYIPEWRNSAKKKLETIPDGHDTGILQSDGSIEWYGGDHKALLDEVEATLEWASARLLPSPPAGFFKYHCKYYYTHGCKSWVWVNNAPCAACLVSYTRVPP